MFWRVDFSADSGQHLSGASPQYLNAAHGVFMGTTKGDRARGQGLASSPSHVCRLSFGCSDPGLYQLCSYSSVSWQNNSSSLQKNLSRAEMLLVLLMQPFLVAVDICESGQDGVSP